MELTKHKKVRISDICIWERAIKGKIYPAGSFCVQVSATKGQMMYLQRAQECESKYCVFQFTSDKYRSFYVYTMFKENLREFLTKMQTGLNIVPDIFWKYEIELHTEIETQEGIEKLLLSLKHEESKEEHYVSVLKDMKKYHLQKMFST